MAYILIVDDEQDLVWAVRHSLRNEGYEVLTAYDGVEALAVAYRQRPDLVILDIAMPRMDGLQVCIQLRQDAAMTLVPILFLTVQSTIEDRIKGLDYGADDYLIKPFDLGELKARVRALLRRRLTPPDASAGTEAHSHELTVGALQLDLQFCQVHVGDRVVQLTPAELELLSHFMNHPGRVFTSRQLLQEVWGYTPEMAEPGLVRWHIMNLRNKIETDPAHPVYICTVPRHGYVMPERKMILQNAKSSSGIQEANGTLTKSLRTSNDTTMNFQVR